MLWTLFCCCGQNTATVMVWYWFNKDPEAQSNTGHGLLSQSQKSIQIDFSFYQKYFLKVVQHMLTKMSMILKYTHLLYNFI